MKKPNQPDEIRPVFQSDKALEPVEVTKTETILHGDYVDTVIHHPEGYNPKPTKTELAYHTVRIRLDGRDDELIRLGEDGYEVKYGYTIATVPWVIMQKAYQK